METLKEQAQVEPPDVKQQAMERAQELLVDVGRMREVLRAVSSDEQPGHIPPDAHQYYGRIEKSLKEIAQLEEKYDFETVKVVEAQQYREREDAMEVLFSYPGVIEAVRGKEMHALDVAQAYSAIAGAGDQALDAVNSIPQKSLGPQSAAEVLDAGSLLEFAKTQRFGFQTETAKSVEFDVMLPSEEILTLTLERPDLYSPLERARLALEGGGEPQFISAPEGIHLLSPQARREWADHSNQYEFSVDLAQKAAEVADVAEMFAQMAAAPGATFGVAEKLLADHIDAQLRAGLRHIDLTQSYLTEDPKAADARHTLALHNLSPQIEMAQKAGVTFDAGEAQLASEQFREIIAIRNTETPEERRFSMGM